MDACELTKYKNIYRYTYWGSFDAKANKHSINKNIYDNRNKFINDYNIKDVYKKPPQYIYKYIQSLLNHKYKNRRFFDHVEEYKTNNNDIIIITSPYGDKFNNYKSKYLPYSLNIGFKKIYQLYSYSGCETYLIHLTKKDIIFFNKNNNNEELLINYIQNNIIFMKNNPKFNKEELCIEAFKPLRIKYQLSIDENYNFE